MVANGCEWSADGRETSETGLSLEGMPAEHARNIEVVVATDPTSIAIRAATDIARHLTDAVTHRGIATLAVSGGSTPALLFDALASCVVPWTNVHLFQVDERVAPSGDVDRNFVQLQAHLLSRVALPEGNVHPIPVDITPTAYAARRYQQDIQAICSGVFDVIHLGLGDDGHTASLVPGDRVLEVRSALVATTGLYKSKRRVTLTYRALNQARSLVWLATGATKVDAVTKLLAGDTTIPAGRVRPQGTNTLYLDEPAAKGLR
jgi:6-phosphogluconolactonase